MTVPHHVAIVMDGNRRWAKERGLPAKAGHTEGGENLERVVSAAAKAGVKVLTAYTFSTENWKRAPWEVKALMELLIHFLTTKSENMVKEGVRLCSIGDVSRLPKAVREALERAKEITKEGKNIDLVLALSYGARDEIVRAASALAADHKEDKVKAIDEALFSNYLDTASWPDPDLLIRTSGELRLSNFLLWQISYAEIYITKAFWPDFGPEQFLIALDDYQKRDRRKGK